MMRSGIGWRAGIGALVVVLALALTFVGHDAAWAAKGGGGKPGGEAAGNNLSFPVIWSEGVPKSLRECPLGQPCPFLSGAVWYWWGTDADGNPESCLASGIDSDFCDDEGELGPEPCEGWVRDAENWEQILHPVDSDCILVYPQQDTDNVWQAESLPLVPPDPLAVDWIDWGDNLESVDWYTRSQVRAEVVLIEDLVTPMLQYEMRHLDGWGIDELWGVATDTYDRDAGPGAVTMDGSQATVYSYCARLAIQRLLVERGDPALDTLTWTPETGWIGEGLVYPPIFNKTVYEALDGPGYYSAEINVKGKIIYGYTWNVRNLNDGAGDYRLTFSFDEQCGGVALNTLFDTATQIVPISEEEEVAAEADEGGDTGGAVAVIDTVRNLTYMDVRILERSGGKKDKDK